MYVYRPIWFVNKKTKTKEKWKIWSIVTVTVTIYKHLQTVKACIINDIGFVAITWKKNQVEEKNCVFKRGWDCSYLRVRVSIRNTGNIGRNIRPYF